MPRLPSVVVLCGGQGTRIQHLLPFGYPKIMASVCGVPFVDVLEDHLYRSGFETIIYATGYGHEHLYRYLKENETKTKLDRYFSRETEPLGTAGAVHHVALKYDTILGGEFFVINGDTVCKLDFVLMHSCHRTSTAWATIATTTEFQSVGTYLFQTDIIKRVDPSADGKLRTTEEFLSECVNFEMSKGVQFFEVNAPFYDIGTPEGMASLWANDRLTIL